MQLIKKLALLFFGLGITAQVAALEPFEVEDIKVEGLQRVELGTFFTYLPLRVGEILDESRVPVIIRSLYDTGYFDFVKLSRDGNVLRINVVERPTISAIVIDGNREIKTENLMDAMKKAGFSRGEVFNRQTLSRIQQEVENQYFANGRYGVKIESNLVDLPRNRVQVRIDIKEGTATKISEINIVGNRVFEDEELIDQFALTTGNFFSFITDDDQYAKEKLSGDLETLRSYYLDRGYLKVNVVSTQVAISPDKESMYVTINVDEGDKYSVSDVQFTGELIEKEEVLRRIYPVTTGDTYSGAAVTFGEENIVQVLGQSGYAFANVNTIPELDEESQTVRLTVFVQPGMRTYVNRVNFSGNDTTNDHVLRREVRLQEGGALSTTLVERSKLRLQRLPYIEEVSVETPRVPGEEDLVDVDFTVKERNAGSLSGGVGFSNTTGINLNASVSHSNFMGSGNRVGISLNTSDAIKNASLNYTNPYFTLDGISMSVGAQYRETDFSELNIIGQSLDSVSFNLGYGIPINEYTRLNAGIGFQDATLKAEGTNAQQIIDFFASFDQDVNLDPELDFQVHSLNFGWERNTLNRGIFPDRGSLNEITMEVASPSGDLSFYKLNYDFQQYLPLNRHLTFLFRTRLSYGDGYGDTEELPYFQNFYAGGSGTVRGFQANTIGPKGIFRIPTQVPSPPGTDPSSTPPTIFLPEEFDQVSLSKRSVGGNARALVTMELFFPTPFIPDNRSVRSSFFVDAGNVWNTDFDRDRFSFLQPEEFAKIPDYSDAGTFRASFGLNLQWLSPLGPLSFSLARPLKEEDDDDTEVFSFNVGKTF